MLPAILAVLCLFGGAIFVHAQSGRPDFGLTGTGSARPNPQTYADTIDRPPLKYVAYALDDLRIGISNLDTTLSKTHIVEPYYKNEFLIPNLGADNSAATHSYFTTSGRAIRLGHHIYDRLFDHTASSSIVEVNRSFWQIHYGKGVNPTIPVLGYSNLSADFYRSFARNIHFNFSYRSMSDEGSVVPSSATSGLQDNSFKRIDLKFSQRSKLGRRVTYLHYDRPAIEENLSTDVVNGGSLLSLARSNQSITLGNSIVFQDSVDTPVKFVLDSKLKYFNRQYSSSGTGLGTSAADLILYDLPGDTLSYSNKIKGLTLSNEINFTKLGGDISLGLDLSLINQTLGAEFSNKFTEGIINIGYKKRFIDALAGSLRGRLGLLDGAGLAGVDVHLDYKFSAQIDLSLEAFARQNIQSLAQRQLVINNLIFQDVNWNSLREQGGQLELRLRRFGSNLQIGIMSMTNHLLPTDDGIFEQIAQPVQLKWVRLNQEVKLGPFYTTHKFLLQDISSNTAETTQKFTIPQLNYSGGIYFNLLLFKKRMSTRWGVDFYAVQGFDTPEFYAVTGMFYNREVEKKGRVLLVNPYLSAKVDDFIFFIKGVNMTHRLVPTSPGRYDYFLTSGFPIYDFRITFGIKWTLLD